MVSGLETSGSVKHTATQRQRERERERERESKACGVQSCLAIEMTEGEA
jgi:hypothetical protein